MDWWYRYQKIIYIILFLLFTIFMAWLLYTVFFSSPETVAPETETGTETAPGGIGLPTAGEGEPIVVDEGEGALEPTAFPERSPADEIAKGGPTQTTPLSQDPVLSPTLNSIGSGAQYYNKKDGLFYQVDSSGNVRKLSDKVFHNVEKVVWSPNKNEAILEYPDGANIIYNFEADKQITLPQHWEDFAFSATGKEMVLKSMGLDPENRWLAIASADGSRVRAVEALGTEDDSVYPAWSNNGQVVALHTKGVDFNRQEVFFIGQNKENFQSMVVEGRGFDPQFSPEGDKLLYSVYSTDTDMNPTLWVSGAQGDNIGANRRSLNIATWASKCAYKDNNTVLCAVPEDLDRGSGLFPEIADSTRDSLYEINMVTGLKKLIAIPEGATNMSDLSISDNGFHLFFTDKTTDRLYKMRLKW